ncbi:DNA (cytosine-5-)-methyltransferase [Streptomyces ipomoeae]|uniref:DNA (cytosine-5-)-methyltransferase n=1 Tax=Streptomyces ipomoeae 91-03 TaxID=698759 RepID=L1KZ95_9ACTN|nr:DNA (cytosine-5-)-methyltransferase [Streptomyces ipomoeae]EKX65957.1 DNA (cytosine-5-)-methyltransferase [Streptomyces ipomoeae 91-03]MDX2697563.1 DNA (cytosine-5-)-methyltransferase [Streptomyces ipomoeae]MDX2824356.1 DNA (cytosine-5-)-methyltransferase [Streptomyces ipomoeae]MDX2843328.1 DNA (cytosine-5-)-methyltransferase [Streptomyces ipomoeae]MDX2877022.1 DNA (cytosine-5-)-methyltransferase [Streptomyces ipomoeae]
MSDQKFTVIELCAGVGGQALGLEQAGFDIRAAVDIDQDSCGTLSHNRPHWHTIHDDLKRIDPMDHVALDHADVLSCGLPRSPYTVAGKQLATEDKRDTLQAVLDMASFVRPRVLLLENIPTFLNAAKFEGERQKVREAVEDLGYEMVSSVLTATDFGVPQHRAHGFMVAMHPEDLAHFEWPEPAGAPCASLGATLFESMSSRGWPEAADWAAHASEPAPLIMGGATGRGGADLGASRAKAMWARWGIYGGSIGDAVPGPDFRLNREIEPRFGLPRLTVDQVALLQGFSPEWKILGRKTSAYRQISQTTPPPIAAALGRRIATALRGSPRTLP